MLFTIIAFTCIAITGFLLFLVLFEPSLPYSVKFPACAIDSDRFICLLGAVCDTQVHRHAAIEVLTGGEQFYQAEIEAIRLAKTSVNLEAFLFTPDAVAKDFVDALTERARAGVRVRVVLDWIGSFGCPDSYFNELRAAGGTVAWYQPLKWYTVKRLNNRTHRELLVIDGQIGFVGGAGIAAHWSTGDNDGRPPWRDMMCRVRGDLVIGLQTTFAENYLEATGRILDVVSEFPHCTDDVCETPKVHGPVQGLVTISAQPPAGQPARACCFRFCSRRQPGPSTSTPPTSFPITARGPRL